MLGKIRVRGPLGRPLTRPDAVAGDKAYSSRGNRAHLRQRGMINKLKAWRGIATRYDKTPGSYLAGLHLRASMIWIKDLTRTTQ